MSITHIIMNAEVEAKQWFKDGDQPDMGDNNYLYTYPYNYLLNGGICKRCGDFMFKHAQFDNNLVRFPICPTDWIIVPPDEEEPYIIPNYLFLQLYDTVEE